MHFLQRRVRGWDDSETWCLATQHAEWFLPRLQRFREISIAYVPSPEMLAPEFLALPKAEQCRIQGNAIADWDQKLVQMIEGFALIAREDGARIWEDKERSKVERALALYREHYFDLWW